MLGRVLDFIFPLECIACGAPGAHACAACLVGLRMSPREFLDGPVPTSSAFSYAQPLVRRLLHDAKYRGWTCALRPLGELARRWAEGTDAWLTPETVVVPVPLHPSKLRARGFNQAMTLARAVAAPLGLRCAEALVRLRRTRPQVDAKDRRSNVGGAFAARRLPDPLRGCPFLLVDDVRTSGATMAACAAALRKAGAGPVAGFALAWGKGTTDPDQNKDEA